MSRIRSRDTSIEVEVRKYLFSRGFRFRKNDKRYAGKPDIVLPKYKTIIFVNGCFWHHHSGCKYSRIPKSNVEYWEAKIQKNVIRDEQNYEMLRNQGWKIIVLWECQLAKKTFNTKMEETISTILLNQITDISNLKKTEENDKGQ